MGKILGKTPTIILLATAGIGLAAAAAESNLYPSRTFVAELTRSMAAGVILGSSTWPYGPTSVPPALQTMVVLRSPDCDPDSQCDNYAPASDAIADWQRDTADVE